MLKPASEWFTCIGATLCSRAETVSSSVTIPHCALWSYMRRNAVLRAQFSGVYWLQEPAALAIMQSTFKAGPVEQFGPPSAELWTAVLVRCNVIAS